MREKFAIHVIYVVGLLDLLGVSMVIPLLTKHARDMGAGPTMAGLVGSVYGFLQLFSCPVVGRWSDVTGRKFSLVCCLLMSAVGYAMMAFGNSVMLLVLARIPIGLFKHSQELSRTYLSDITPEKQHPRVFGLFNSFSNIGFIIGPVVGGHIFDTFGGFKAVALTTAASFLLNLLLVLVLMPSVSTQRPRCESPGRQQNIQADQKQSCKLEQASTWKLSAVWDVFLVRFLLGTSIIVYRHDFVSTVINRYQSTTTSAGYVTSFASVVGTATGFAVGHISDRYGNDSERMFRHCALLQAVSMLLLVLSPNVVLLALFQAALSVSSSVGRVVAIDLTMSRGGRRHAGALMGAGSTVLSGARILSPTIGGLLQEVDENLGPAVMSVVLATAGTVLMFSMRNRTKVKAE